MSPWLKTRLLTLFCGALLIGGASYSYLHAQTDYGPPAKTPEEAATNFWRLLDVIRQPNVYMRYSLDEVQFNTLTGSIMRAQFQRLSGTNSEGNEKLITLLASQANSPAIDTQVQGTNGGQTIVSVVPNPQPKGKEIVVVREDGGYRVDIVATYGRWNHLSGGEADKALYKATGWVSPTLSTQSEYMGTATQAQCQSNLKQIGLAIAMYTQDWDERLPPARSWTNATEPYLKNRQIYTCPAVVPKSNGYAYNSKLSRFALAGIMSPAQTVQAYETSNTNLNVFAPFTGKAYRHARVGVLGMNICFSDGHVKWYKQDDASKLNINPDVG